jgi:hypothetical protein
MIFTVTIGTAHRTISARRVLAKGRNAADDRFTTRPKGATRMPQYGVAALEKDWPSQVVFFAKLTDKH